MTTPSLTRSRDSSAILGAHGRHTFTSETILQKIPSPGTDRMGARTLAPGPQGQNTNPKPWQRSSSGPDRRVRRGKVLFQVAPTRSATTFLKPFILNKFKLHPMLDVRQRSRLFTEEGGKTRPADTAAPCCMSQRQEKSVERQDFLRQQNLACIIFAGAPAFLEATGRALPAH